jgi:membrane-bound lytic murein transglycosylase D
MILANFNRSSYYLFILNVLMLTGCAEQSASHLTMDQEKNAKTIVNEMLEPQPAVQPQQTVQQAQPIVQPKIEAEAIRQTVAESQVPIISQKTVVRQTSVINPQLPFAQKIQHKQSVTKSIANSIATIAVNRHTRSLWTRLFSMYALPEADNPRVTQEVQNFLKHPKNLTALQRRAQPYLYMIVDQLDTKQMPGELALLPMIESAFQVNAQSHAEAAGLWQFTPSTGTTFGLKQNWWYDGRRDVFASTEAATTYLKRLNKQFDGNWLLALASYNSGARTVQKAIKKNLDLSLDTSFWSLDLPDETKSYVPKLLAIAKILSHAEEYNLALHPIPNAPLFKAVDISSQLDLSTAAELAGMPADEFFNLNPAFNHAITAPDGSYKLLIKSKNAAAFKRKLAKLPKTELVKWTEHTIKVGEDLNAIAKLHEVPVETIIEINQLKDQKLVIGSILRLPPQALPQPAKTTSQPAKAVVKA